MFKLLFNSCVLSLQADMFSVSLAQSQDFVEYPNIVSVIQMKWPSCGWSLFLNTDKQRENIDTLHISCECSGGVFYGVQQALNKVIVMVDIYLDKHIGFLILDVISY